MSPPRIVLDRVGFPLVWSDSLSGHVNLIAITKIQFECFLCDTHAPLFDAKFYDELLRLNPRVSPGRIGADNFQQVFATGLVLSDAAMFAEWYGAARDERFESLSEAEWFTMYDEFRGKPAWSLDELRSAGICERASRTFDGLFTVLKRRTVANLADACLLDRGVYEWVHTPGGPGLIGRPDKGDQGIVRLDGAGRKAREVNVIAREVANGIRLLRRNG